jgi:hypothetical protein
MRTRFGAAVILSGCMLCSAPARADSDSGTSLAVPGRPDVPVFVNPLGIDASFGIVEGEFGLNKPAMGNAHTIGPPTVVRPGPRRFFFPHDENMPGYGRYEIAPPRQSRPQHAESYHRSWETASDPLPASTDPPYPVNIDVQPYVTPWGPWHPGQGRRGGFHGRGRR